VSKYLQNAISVLKTVKRLLLLFLLQKSLGVLIAKLNE
jgi:hypothetical protein